MDSFCTKCGTQLESGQNFCSKCGNKKDMTTDTIAQTNPDIVTQSKHTSPWIPASETVVFGKSKGLLKSGLVFYNENKQPIYWAKEDSVMGNSAKIFSDVNKSKLIVHLENPGLFGDVVVNDGNGIKLGTINWQGGPVVSKWNIVDSNGKVTTSEERMGVLKYIFKLLVKFIPVAVDTSAKTGTLTFFSGPIDYGYALRSGSWFSPKYSIHNVSAITKQVDFRLLIGAMTLEAMYSNK